MDKIATLIQQHIKEYRASTGLTLRQFAEELGVSHAVVSNWERGVKIPKSDVITAASYEVQHMDFLINFQTLVAEYKIRRIETMFGHTRNYLKQWTEYLENPPPAENAEIDISC